MQYVAIAAAVVGAVGSVQAGQAQRRMYELQAQQSDLEGRRKALQYEQRANLTLENLRATNAAAAARAYAGGVQGFDGSAALIQTVNTRKGGRDFSIELTNAANAEQAGITQGKIYKQAGKDAEMAGYFDAVGKLGTAAYMYSNLGGAPSSAGATTQQATSTTYWKSSALPPAGSGSSYWYR